MGYLSNFIVYTFAMVGVIDAALLVFKNATSGGNMGKKSKYLRIIDSMSLGQRKNLYIVSTGKERFLIAGDVDKTSLISKLENFDVDMTNNKTVTNDNNFKETLNSVSKADFMDKSNIGIRSSMLSSNKNTNSVMRKLAEKMGA